MKLQLGRLGADTSTGRLIWLLVIVVLVVFAMPLWLAPGPSGPSVESRAADGFLGIRRILQEWGVTVQRIQVHSADDVAELAKDHGVGGTGGQSKQSDPDTEKGSDTEAGAQTDTGPATLVVAFPASTVLLEASEELDKWVRGGGSLMVSYSGRLLALEEDEFLAEFGATTKPDRDRGSILPWRWWRHRRGGQKHVLVSALDEAAGEPDPMLELVSDRLSAMATVSAGCEPMVEVAASGKDAPSGFSRNAAGDPGLVDPDSVDPDSVDSNREGGPTEGVGAEGVGAEGSGAEGAARGEAAEEEIAKEVGTVARARPSAAVVRCRHGDGILWLVPTSTLVNARISNGGNLELLWRLAQDLGEKWVFLEGGRQLPAAAGEVTNVRSARATLNLMAVQLVLLYLGSVLALAWRFGPRWSEGRLPPEGHRGFLLGLGALHQKLGGLSEAAKLLHERWLDYDPMARRRTWTVPSEVDPEGEEMSAEELVQQARAYSRRSMGRGV